jgi:hypothetical protein
MNLLLQCITTVTEEQTLVGGREKQRCFKEILHSFDGGVLSGLPPLLMLY